MQSYPARITLIQMMMMPQSFSCRHPRHNSKDAKEKYPIHHVNPSVTVPPYATTLLKLQIPIPDFSALLPLYLTNEMSIVTPSPSELSYYSCCMIGRVIIPGR